jgi:hypothetical protein
MLGGRVVIPRNVAIVLQVAKVEQAGDFKGSDAVSLKANSLSFGGRKYDIVTNYVERKEEGEGKKTTRKVAGGARPGRHHRRHRGRRDGRGHWRARRRRCGSHRLGDGYPATEDPRRHAAAVQVERGGDRQP